MTHRLPGQGASPTRILMLYNADSGLINGALDSLHKIFSPGTYTCQLCALTYGLATMKADWRDTLEALPYPVAFLHKDEWQTQFPDNPTPLPAILLESGPDLKTLVSAEDFAGLISLQALQTLLTARLQE